MDAASGYVFVYGLLLRGQPLHHYIAGGTFVGEATARGTLYTFGKYPGVVESDGVVRGELYFFDDVAAVLDVLDDVEEFEPSDPDSSLYLRKLRPASTAAGGSVDAWIYIYNGDLTQARRVATGDWMDAATAGPTGQA